MILYAFQLNRNKSLVTGSRRGLGAAIPVVVGLAMVWFHHQELNKSKYKDRNFESKLSSKESGRHCRSCVRTQESDGF